MSTKKNKKSKPAKSQPESNGINPESIQFWLSVVRALLPDEESEWRQMEMAVILRLQTGLVVENWDAINKVASANEDKLAVAWAWQSDRSVTPPTVKVSGGYGAKRKKMKAESDCPDPDQKELPGIEPEPEVEEPPRVHAGASED
jgi:hypothetical protein